MLELSWRRAILCTNTALKNNLCLRVHGEFALQKMITDGQLDSLMKSLQMTVACKYLVWKCWKIEAKCSKIAEERRDWFHPWRRTKLVRPRQTQIHIILHVFLQHKHQLHDLELLHPFSAFPPAEYLNKMSHISEGFWKNRSILIPSTWRN